MVDVKITVHHSSAIVHEPSAISHAVLGNASSDPSRSRCFFPGTAPRAPPPSVPPPPRGPPTAPPPPRPPARVAPLMPLAIAVAGGVVADRYGAAWGTPMWLTVAAGLGVLGPAV